MPDAVAVGAEIVADVRTFQKQGAVCRNGRAVLGPQGAIRDDQHRTVVPPQVVERQKDRRRNDLRLVDRVDGNAVGQEKLPRRDLHPPLKRVDTDRLADRVVNPATGEMRGLDADTFNLAPDFPHWREGHALAPIPSRLPAVAGCVAPRAASDRTQCKLASHPAHKSTIPAQVRPLASITATGASAGCQDSGSGRSNSPMGTVRISPDPGRA